MTTCVYHSDRAGTAECAECRNGICDECRNEVAGKPVCARCVEAIRARVAAEIDMAAAPLGPPAAPGYMHGGEEDYPPTPYGGSQPSGFGPPSALPVAQHPPSPTKVLAGIGLGLLFGLIGAFILKTIHFYAHFGLSFFNIILGWAVGFGVITGSGKRGFLPAIIAAVLAFAAMMLSDYMLITAMVNERYGVSLGLGTLPLSGFIERQKQVGVMHWICIAFGVWSAYSMCMQRDPTDA